MATSEVDRLVDLMVDLLRANGKSPNPSRTWHDAVLELLQRVPATRVEAAIRFVTSEPFWSERVFTLPYLLNKWDSISQQLPAELLVAEGSGVDSRGARWPTVEAKLRRTLGLARIPLSDQEIADGQVVDTYEKNAAGQYEPVFHKLSPEEIADGRRRLMPSEIDQDIEYRKQRLLGSSAALAGSTVLLFAAVVAVSS